MKTGKHKFYIWLSIFLSLLPLGVHTSAPQIPERQFELIQYTRAMPELVTIPNVLATGYTTTTSTTTLPETTTTQKTTTTSPPETVPVEETPPGDYACGPYKMSREEAHACWDGLIGQYDWPFTTAFNTMYCESTGDYDIRNSTSSATGLFQILNGPIDPESNVATAYGMWQESGWNPWVCKG